MSANSRSTLFASKSYDADASRRKERNPRLFLFVLIGFCLFFIISYTSRLLEYSQAQELLASWEERNIEADERQSELVAQREFVYSDEYVDKIAREDLGLAKPGDNMIVIIPDGTKQPELAQVDISTVQPHRNPMQLPIWQQWLALFKQDSSARPSL